MCYGKTWVNFLVNPMFPTKQVTLWKADLEVKRDLEVKFS